MNDAEGNYVASELERRMLYGAPWKGPEFDLERVKAIRWREDPIEEALMDKTRSVLEDLYVYTTGKPFGAYPRGERPWEVEKALKTPEGAIDFLPSITEGMSELTDEETSPKERAMARSRVNLFNLKRRLFPILDVYLKEIEAHPELDSRNTMAGVVMTTLMYATKMTDLLKCIKMLQEIFGHTQATVVVEDKTSLETRKARLLATVRSSLAENGLLGGIIDAEVESGDGGGDRGDAAVSAGAPCEGGGA